MVADREAHAIALFENLDLNWLARRRELGCVHDQIHQHVLHRRTLGVHRRQALLHVELERVIVGQGHEVVADPLHKLGEVGADGQL